MAPRRRIALSILSIVAAACAGAHAGAGDAPPRARTVSMRVTDAGFEPNRVALRRGEPVELVITRTTSDTCAREIVLDEYGIHTPLPLNTAVTVAFTPAESGELRYGCAMGKMIGGVLVIE